MAYSYIILGKTVASDFEIPEAIPFAGAIIDAEIRITLGAVQINKETATAVTHRSYLNTDLEYFLEIENVARFKAVNGRHIVVMPSEGADPEMVRTYLLGTVLAAICYQRDLLPLHASCVNLPAGAIAIAGKSGAGKSTLAACLAGSHHSLIADDTCAIDISNGPPCVLPTVSRIKLWPDSVEIARLTDISAAKSAVSGKFHFYKVNKVTPVTAATPLKAIFFLEKSESLTNPQVRQIEDQREVIGLLLSNLPRKKIVQALKLDQKVLETMTAIAAMVPTYSLRRGPHRNEVQQLVNLVKSVL